MIYELQQYIPYSSYKFLGNPGAEPTNKGVNAGYWENDSRWGLMGLGGLGQAPYAWALPTGIPVSTSQDLGIPPYTEGVPLTPINVVGPSTQQLINLPQNSAYTNPNLLPAYSTDIAGGSVGCPGTDPGLGFGLQTWQGLDQWGTNLSNIFNISDWLCYPLAMIGTVLPPMALGALILFMMGRGSKRGR